MRRWSVALFCPIVLGGLALACLALAQEPSALQVAAKPGAPAPRGWVELALERQVSVDFSEKPLAEVAQKFAEQADAQILIDREALNGVGLGVDVPASLHGTPTSLRNALTRLLRPLELTWVAQDGVILITTTDKAENHPVTRVYPMGDLLQGLIAPRLRAGLPLPRRGSRPQIRLVQFGMGVSGRHLGDLRDARHKKERRAEALAGRLESLIAPKTWAKVGGPGSAKAVYQNLVVSQTEAVHRRIARLLDLLREAPIFDPKQPPGPLPPLRDKSPENKRVREALLRPVSLDLKETPLGKAMRQLEAAQHLVIDADLRAFNRVGMPTDAPVTLRVEQVPLAVALRHLLEQLDLTYLVRDGVLLVTTEEEEETAFTTVVYPVGDLIRVPPDANGEEVAAELDRLIETIQSTVEPASWKEVGGPGAIERWTSRAALLIRNGKQTHDKVARLIGQLRAAQASRPQVPLPPSDEQAMVTQSIAILPLLPIRGDNGERLVFFPAERLEEVLRALLDSNEWSEKGAYLKVLPGRVIVRHRPRVVRKVEDLLVKLSLRGGGTAHTRGMSRGIFNMKD